MKRIVLKSTINVIPHTEANVEKGVAVYADDVLKGFVVRPLEGFMITYLHARTSEVYVNLEDLISDNKTLTFKQMVNE